MNIETIRPDSPDVPFPAENILTASVKGGASVVMDHRERPSGMDELLRQIPDVDVRFDTLETADYSVDGRLLVERKTVADFAESIIDTRLFRQASRLSQAPCPALIILEGRGSDFSDTPVSREALQGALITLTLIYRLPLLRALDKQETARLIIYSARQLHRSRNNSYTLNYRKPKSLQGRKVQLLRMLPGVGTDRAKNLLKTFGSVEKCLTASREELAAVEGIGAKTAEAIRRVIEKEPEGQKNE